MRAVTRSAARDALGQAAQELPLGHRDRVAGRAPRQYAHRERAVGRVAYVPSEPRRAALGIGPDLHASARRAATTRPVTPAVETLRPLIAGQRAHGQGGAELARVRRGSRRRATRTATAAPSSTTPAGTRATAVRPSAASRVSSSGTCKPHLDQCHARERISGVDAHLARQEVGADAADRRRARIHAERSLDHGLVAGAVARDDSQHVGALGGDRDAHRPERPPRRRRASTSANAAAARVARGERDGLRATAPATPLRVPDISGGSSSTAAQRTPAARAGDPRAREQAHREADLAGAVDERCGDSRLADTGDTRLPMRRCQGLGARTCRRRPGADEGSRDAARARSPGERGPDQVPAVARRRRARAGARSRPRGRRGRAVPLEARARRCRCSGRQRRTRRRPPRTPVAPRGRRRARLRR